MDPPSLNTLYQQRIVIMAVTLKTTLAAALATTLFVLAPMTCAQIVDYCNINQRNGLTCGTNGKDGKFTYNELYAQLLAGKVKAATLADCAASCNAVQCSEITVNGLSVYYDAEKDYCAVKSSAGVNLQCKCA